MQRRDFLAGVGALGAALTSNPALARTSPKAFVADLRDAWQGWRQLPRAEHADELDRQLEREGLQPGALSELFACIGAAQHLKEAGPEVLSSPEGEALALELGEVHARAWHPLNDWLKALPRRRRRQLRKVLRDDPTLVSELADRLAERVAAAGHPERAQLIYAAADEVAFRVENQDADLLVDPLTERTDAAVARASAKAKEGDTRTPSEKLRHTAKWLALASIPVLGLAAVGVWGAGETSGSIPGAFVATFALLAVFATVALLVAALVLLIIATKKGSRWIGSISGRDAELQLVVEDDGHTWGFDKDGAVARPVWGRAEDDSVDLTLRRPDAVRVLRGERTATWMPGDVLLDGVPAGTWSLVPA